MSTTNSKHDSNTVITVNPDVQPLDNNTSMISGSISILNKQTNQVLELFITLDIDNNIAKPTDITISDTDFANPLHILMQNNDEITDSILHSLKNVNTVYFDKETVQLALN